MEFLNDNFFIIALTFGVYYAAKKLQAYTGWVILNPILVAIVVGVTNIIPFFGPIVGAIPCLMILVIVDPWAALRFLILVIALQQFDGNILGPKILGDSTGLSAIWVLVAIVVGGGLFGFPGMVLGVPTFAVLYDLVRQWVNKRLVKKGIDGNGKPLEPANSGNDPKV